MSESKVTAWERGNAEPGGKITWAHNHIENGWSELGVPTPISMLQGAQWNGVIWRKRHTYLRDGVLAEGGLQPMSDAAVLLAWGDLLSTNATDQVRQLGLAIYFIAIELKRRLPPQELEPFEKAVRDRVVNNQGQNSDLLRTILQMVADS